MTTNRLTDEQVAWYAGTSRTARWTAEMSVHENIVTLAREAQTSRARIAELEAGIAEAISALAFGALHESVMKAMGILADLESPLDPQEQT